MSRVNLRWWLSMSLVAFAFSLGFAVSALVTPTVEKIVWLEVGCHPWENGGNNE